MQQHLSYAALISGAMSQADHRILREQTCRQLITDHSQCHVHGRGAGRETGKICDSDFQQSETEALNQDFLLHDGSSVGEGIWGESVCGSAISVTQ